MVLPPWVNQSDWLDGDLDVAALEDGTDDEEDGKGDLPRNEGITYYEVYNKREHYRIRLREQIIYVSYLEKEFLQHLRIPKMV